MVQKKPYLFPVWVFGAIFFLRFFFLVYVYHTIGPTYREYTNGTNWVWVIFLYFIWPLIALVTTLLYWWLRNKSLTRWWVHVHVWTGLLIYAIFPLLNLLLAGIAAKFPQALDLDQLLELTGVYLKYVFWSLLIIGNILFIASIAKALSQPKPVFSNEASSGILDEFVE